MYMNVWAMNGVDLGQLNPFLNVLGANAGDVRQLHRFDDKNDGSERDLFLCVSPEAVVASAVEAGLDFESVLDAWLCEAEILTDRHLERAVRPLVIFIDDLIAPAPEFVESLVNELALEVDVFPDVGAKCSHCHGLTISLSSDLVQDRAEVTEVRGRLIDRAVTSKNFALGVKGDDTSSFLSDLKGNFAQIEKLRQSNDRLRKENGVMLAQLQQSELELQSILTQVQRERRSLKRSKKTADSHVPLSLSILKKTSRILKRVVNPRNPTVWRLTSVLRTVSRPLRNKLAVKFSA